MQDKTSAKRERARNPAATCARLYGGLGSGRLVIVGPPGSGKRWMQLGYGWPHAGRSKRIVR